MYGVKNVLICYSHIMPTFGHVRDNCGGELLIGLAKVHYI